LGVAYYRAGKKAEAAQSLRMALKVQPGFPNAAEAKQILQTLNN